MDGNGFRSINTQKKSNFSGVSYHVEKVNYDKLQVYYNYILLL